MRQGGILRRYLPLQSRDPEVERWRRAPALSVGRRRRFRCGRRISDHAGREEGGEETVTGAWVPWAATGVLAGTGAVVPVSPLAAASTGTFVSGAVEWRTEIVVDERGNDGSVVVLALADPLPEGGAVTPIESVHPLRLAEGDLRIGGLA